jgi:hypothetical protein
MLIAGNTHVMSKGSHVLTRQYCYGVTARLTELAEFHETPTRVGVLPTKHNYPTPKYFYEITLKTN